MIDIEFNEITQEALEQPHLRDRADARTVGRVMDFAQRHCVQVLMAEDVRLSRGNVQHLAADKPQGSERMRGWIVLVGVAGLLAGIAVCTCLATSDGVRCQYLHDQTACARLEWQSALALAKKRFEARL